MKAEEGRKRVGQRSLHESFCPGRDLMPGFNFPSFVYHRVVKLSFYNNRGNIRAETVEPPTERIATDVRPVMV